MFVEQRARLRHQSEITALPLEGGALQWLIDRDLGAAHVMAYRLVLDPDSATSHVPEGVWTTGTGIRPLLRPQPGGLVMHAIALSPLRKLHAIMNRR